MGDQVFLFKQGLLLPKLDQLPHCCSGCPCRLLLLDRIEAGRLAAQERERREQEQAAAAAAAAAGQSNAPCVRQLPDTGQRDMPPAAATAPPVDATAMVAAANVPGGSATLRHLERTASSKGSQEVLAAAVAATAAPAPAQHGHIKHD